MEISPGGPLQCPSPPLAGLDLVDAVRLDKVAEFLSPAHSSRLPFFPELLRTCPAEGEGPLHQDHVEDIPWVRNALGFIKVTCERFHFEVRLADLTIIQDQRLIARSGRTSYLVNYVACYQECAARPEIAAAYLQALTSMGQQQGTEPPVPHLDFYQYLYLAVPQIAAHKAFCSAPSAGATPLHLSKQSAFRQRYPYRPGSSSSLDIPRQIRRLVGRFLRALGEAMSPFANALLLAVPFLRAAFQPLLTGASAAPGASPPLWQLLAGPSQQLPSPGGGLFLVLDPLPDPSPVEVRLRDCAYALRTLLLSATLSESTNQLDLSKDFNELLANMVHASVTAVRAVSANNLCQLLSPDPLLQTLRFEIHDRPSGKRNERQETQLLNAAKLISLGEDTAAALLSLAEIAILGGSIPSKYTATQEQDLWDLIDQAVALTAVLALQPFGLMKPITLEVTSPRPHWVLPAGYLDRSIVRGFLLEILRNSSRHGKRPAQEAPVPVSIDMTASASGGVRVSVRSPVEESGAEEWSDTGDGIIVRRAVARRQSFLTRFAALCQRVPRLQIATDIDRGAEVSLYCTHLTLGPLSLEAPRPSSTDNAPFLRE